MRKLIPLIAAIAIISSCSQEEFSVSNAALSCSGDDAVFSADFSLPDDTYTFRLTSPDGALTWEGAMNGEGEAKSSVPIEITDGARLPEGEYSIMLYSSNGTEISIPVELSYSVNTEHISSDTSAI